MLRTMKQIGWWAALLAPIAAVHAADDLAVVEKNLTTVAAKLKSLSGTLSMDMKMSQFGQSMVVKGAGTYEMMKAGEKNLSRMELKMNMTMGEGDAAMKMEGSSLTVVDGEFAYTLNDQMGNKMAVKSKPDTSKQLSGGAMLATLKVDNTLTLMPEGKVNGHTVYIVKAAPKIPNPMNPMTAQVYYFDKEHGYVHKLEGVGTDGSPVMTMMVTDVKINPTIAKDRFVWKTPEGVQLMDQTAAVPAAAPAAHP